MSPKILPSEYLTRGWTRLCMARTQTGRPCLPNNPSAKRWCLMGAFSAALAMASWPPDRVMNLLREETFQRFNAETLVEFNDCKLRKKTQVIEIARIVEKRLGWRH